MSTKKKVILSLLITVFVVGITVAVLFIVKKNTKNKKEVAVYPVSEIGYYDSYDYSGMETLSGNVSVSMEQKIYLTSEQKIEELCVSEGDSVKAGDLILKYDVTAQNLQLEIKRTEVEMAKVRITTLERELQKLKETTPYEPPAEPPATEQPATEQPVTEEPATGETATPGDPTVDPSTENPPADEQQPDNVPPDDSNEQTDPDGFESDEPQYTKEELEAAIAQKEIELKDARINAQLEEINYEIMQYQNSSAELYCNFDGVVKTVADQDTAIMENSPYIVISSMDGYTIESDIGEMALMNVKVGDSVTISNWENGMTYAGVITEISDIPTDENYYYSAIAQSYYPIRISIPEADDLRPGMYVDIMLDGGSGAAGMEEDIPEEVATEGDAATENEMEDFYMPLSFVRKENGSYYMMCETDGKLKKVYVKTGKIRYGSEIEILGGITGEEYIAFPYSKNATEGVKTRQASIDELYN